MPDSSWQRTVERALQAYEQGRDTRNDAYTQIVERLDPSDISELMELMPQDFVSQLQEEAGSAPHTEEGWAELRLIHIGGVTLAAGHTPPAAEEERAFSEQCKRVYRRRIELVREYFDNCED